MKNKTYITIDRDRRYLSTNIYFFRIEDGKEYIGEVVFTEARDGQENVPAMRLKQDDGEQIMQDIMNSLWEQGVRPDDIGTPGHLAATKDHLNDMRKIAFHQLGIEG